ncbi:protein of unknown function [Modestobacter italicus]|uniref:Uncharacterized protein n=1 Tax=Modestobacter italicus (strain DSM 44449 / CECT 9708 / BC 501) TaxID=2732864 RepID=I4EUP1_MODI5|nr:protein of unknown function [Modestobacter marinus]
MKLALPHHVANAGFASGPSTQALPLTPSGGVGGRPGEGQLSTLELLTRYGPSRANLTPAAQPAICRSSSLSFRPSGCARPSQLHRRLRTAGT